MTPPTDTPADDRPLVETPADDRRLAAERPGEAGAGWIVPLIIGTAMLMQTLNGTVMSNALPTIAHAFGVAPLRLNLAITIYLLATAVFLPISGWAADRFGAKRVFLAAMILFTIASTACGFAQNLFQMVAARFVQGVAGAMMMPVGRLVLLRTTPKSEITNALAMVMLPALFGPMLGPLIGGFIVTYWDWRWIFFVNLPIAAAGVALVIRYVPNVSEQEARPLDWWGLVMTGVGMTGIIFGFDSVGRDTIHPLIVTGFFVGGFGAMALYVLYARGNPKAILDLSVFRLKTFSASVYGGSFMRVGMVSTPFMLAMLLQVGFGMTPLQAGVLTAMSSLGALFMKVAAPPILRRFGFRGVLLVDSVIAAAFMAANGFFQPSTPQWLIMIVLLSGGFFRSLQFTAFNGLTYAEVEQSRMSAASTMSSMVQQLVQSVGVALAAMMLHILMLAHGETHLTAETVAPAFWIMGGISLIAALFVIPLPKNVGEDLHPERRRR